MTEECIIRHTNGVELRTDVYPNPVDYIRVVGTDGEEIAYWHIDEISEDPSEVIGAIFGAVLGGQRL